MTVEAAFERRRAIFLGLCRKYGLPAPAVTRELPEDPCDFTSGAEVRLNVPAAGPISDRRHAHHVWGHWLCCLHAEADEREGGAPVTDLVADTVARLLLGL